MSDNAGGHRALIYLLAIGALVMGASVLPPEEAEQRLDEQDLVAAGETPWQLKTARDSMASSLDKLTHLDSEEAYEVVLLVEEEAAKYDLDPFRVLALLIAESHGDSQVVSEAGAIGLMQIMPRTGEFIAKSMKKTWRGQDSLFEVETNITYGVWYYHYLLKYFRGDEHAAMAAYNWGPEHIQDRLRKGERLPSVYPSRILAAEASLEREFKDAATSHLRQYFSEPDYLASGDNGPTTSRSGDSDRRLPVDSREGL